MKVIALVTLLILNINGQAQTFLLNEKFDNGIPAGWTVVDVDGNTPNATVSQFTSAWIGYTTSFDTCAASTSYYTDSLGTSQDYLITPVLNVLTFGNMLSWDAKSFDASYPDSYVVLISTTDTNPNSFTDTLIVVIDENPYWKHYSYDLASKGYINQTIYVAFKNITTNGFVLGVDNVVVTADDPAEVKENDFQFSIYPNPAVDVLNISVDGLVNNKLYTINGQLILESNQKTLNVSTLTKGIYILKVTTQKGVVERKIVIG
jgi:hypothetical protein